MDYRPRYQQPFTLEEARQLPLPLITEEIARLQHSLAHLQRTQGELRDALADAPGDADLVQALEENEVVIGSQNERIGMLRMVLSEKGIVAGAHYDVVATPAPDTSRRMQNRQNGLEDDIEEHPREEADAIRAEEEAEGGVYL